jgi:hypothetical protein
MTTKKTLEFIKISCVFCFFLLFKPLVFAQDILPWTETVVSVENIVATGIEMPETTAPSLVLLGVNRRYGIVVVSGT